MAQCAAMERAGLITRQNGYPHLPVPSRAAYGAQVNRGKTVSRYGGA